MKPKTFMLIAGEASGDVLAAELVKALRTALPEAEAQSSEDCQPLHATLEPRFFGAGGPKMTQAGVEVVVDMMAHSVVGISEVLRKLGKFRRLLQKLLGLAIAREPDAIICVDYSGLNLRFARAVKRHVHSQQGTFANWNPKIIQYVSPQVWASRPGRAAKMEQILDLLLSIFPFEKEWYARQAPKLAVEFIGHPLVDRYKDCNRLNARVLDSSDPLILLLPGSRPAELERHLPVMLGACEQVVRKRPSRLMMVLPNEKLQRNAEAQIAEVKQRTSEKFPPILVQVGGLPGALSKADLAIASTGTVTMECAWFGVPTVALYRAAWGTYQVAKRVVSVRFIAMPNILAKEELYPEFIQNQATPENLARAALELLTNDAWRNEIKTKLGAIIKSLGPPGAAARGAERIARLITKPRLEDLKTTLSVR